MLQERFKILRHEFHEWEHNDLSLIMNTCVIIHNMQVNLRIRGMLVDELNIDGTTLSSWQVIEESKKRKFYRTGKSTIVDVNDWMEELWARGFNSINTAHDRLRKALDNHILNLVVSS